MKAENFLSLSKREAQHKAEAAGLIFRLIRIDDCNYFSYPDDVNEQRLCVEIDKGVVT